MSDLEEEVNKKITGRVIINAKGKDEDYSPRISEGEHPDLPWEDAKYCKECPYTEDAE